MKISAMFLPQFHEDPWNSKWWGEGFTEWDNVRAAKPLFPEHRQPRVPANGYFDLTDEAELVLQSQMAKRYGIDAFTFYDYWYDGTKLLGAPLQKILTLPEFDIEFSLCWANHSWTRSWTNRTGALDVLIEQTYPSDKQARIRHFDYLAKVFSDNRYVRINGKPLIQIYDVRAVPVSYIDDFRRHVEQLIGVEPHIDALITAWQPSWDFLNNYNSATLFQPSVALFSPVEMFSTTAAKATLETRLRSAPLPVKKLLYYVQDMLPNQIKKFPYDENWEKLLLQYRLSGQASPIPLNPMAFVDFDNTPRYRDRARIVEGYSAEIFKNGMKRLLKEAKKQDTIGYCFINAWNEWGEGAYLQPDESENFSRLEAIYDAKKISA